MEINQNSRKYMKIQKKTMKIYEIHEHVWDIFVLKKEDGLYFIF